MKVSYCYNKINLPVNHSQKGVLCEGWEAVKDILLDLYVPW